MEYYSGLNISAEYRGPMFQVGVGTVAIVYLCVLVRAQ